MRRPSLIPILALTLAAPAAAQSEDPVPADEPVLALGFEGLIEVSEVLLDVLATDVEGDLSYRSEHPAGEIGDQRIEVKARDESVQVRAREGYRYGL